jgi:uncharacterized OB-fold protein
MTTPSYPTPRADTDNAAFLAGWREGRLVLQACNACSKAFFYPRAFCPHCWSDRIENRYASGKGRIVSYSLVHRPNDPAGGCPFWPVGRAAAARDRRALPAAGVPARLRRH